MSHNRFLSKIATVERIASASKIQRMLVNPFRYFDAFLFRTLVYRQTKQEKEIQCKTFFGVDMNLLLPSSTDIYLTGGKSHETEIRLAKFLIKNLNEGDTFFDIGAHYGYFSLLASQLVGAQGRVFSFEPSPTTFRILNKNQSKHANITVNNLAVSDTNSTLTFYEFPNLYSEYNTLDVSQFKNEDWFKASPPKEINIDAIVLDDFLKEKNATFKIVKIDVEGAEFKVIGGMKKYLESYSPMLVMEYLSDDRGNEPHIKAEAFLADLGFEPYLIDNEGTLQKVNSVVEHLRAKGLESDNIAFVKNNIHATLTN